MHGRQGNAFVPQPQMNLADALKLGELEEDQRNPFAYPSIWIHGDAVMALLHIADRHGEEEFVTSRLLLQSLQRTLPQNRQFQNSMEIKPVIAYFRISDWFQA